MFDRKVVDYFMVKKTKGDVGIEIECELEREAFEYNFDPIKKIWRIEEDGSLKVNGLEFVLKRPVSFKDAHKVVGDFRDFFNHNDIIIRDSFRAGIHCHINMQEQTISEVFKFALIYYVMETVLTRSCGGGREGNQFCLRNRDAAGFLNELEGAVQYGAIDHLQSDKYRYCALNFQSLFTYGSLELRSFATNPTLSGVEDWITILQKIKTAAISQGKVWDIAASVSGEGPKAWMRGILGDELTQKLSYDGMEDDMMEDLRLTQMLVFFLSEKGL